MGYLIGSVILNSLIGIIFRYYRQFGINNMAAIVVNYFVCFGIGTMVSGGETLDFSSTPASWLPVLLILGLLFILAFNAIAATVQSFGVTVATLVQKMSVVLVVGFAILVYNEPLNTWRVLGLLLGFVAIFLMSGKSEKHHGYAKRLIIALPFIVFFMTAAIDTIFLAINRLALNIGAEDRFAAYLFGTAGLFGIVYISTALLRGKRYRRRDLVAGVVLGLPNFFTVYCIQKMLNTDLDGSVIFPIHNIGILLVSAILSKILFNEHFATLKYVGVILAVSSIVMLALGS